MVSTPQSSSSTTAWAYRAFISYARNAEDSVWSAWLQKALEQCRVPTALRTPGHVGRRLGRIFRDTDDLGAAPSLAEALQAALSQSEALVVICSRASQQSRWVQLEVEHFVRVRDRAKVILVLVDGEPEQAFPTALLPGDPGEQVDLPMAVDARPVVGGSLRQRRKRVLTRVVAALLGVAPDELARRQQQRQLRIASIVTVAALTVATAMTALAMFAIDQRELALRNADDARQQTRIALEQERKARLQLAKSLSDQGYASFRMRRWMDGFAVLDRAREILEELGKPSLRLDFRLLQTESETPVLPYRYLESPLGAQLAASRTGDRLAIEGDDQVLLVDMVFDRLENRLSLRPEPLELLEMSGSGNRVAVGQASTVTLYDARAARMIGSFDVGSQVLDGELIRDRAAMVVATYDGGVYLLDWDRWTRVELSDRQRRMAAFDLSEDGSTVAAAWTDGTTMHCRLTASGCADRQAITTGEVRALALTPDAAHVMIASPGALSVWDTRTGMKLRQNRIDARTLEIVGDLMVYSDIDGNITTFDYEEGFTLGSLMSPSATPAFVFSPRRASVVTTADTGLLYWQITFGSLPGAGQSAQLPEGTMLNGVAVSPDGRVVASVDSQGWLRLFRSNDMTPLWKVRAHGGEALAVDFSGSERWLATAGSDGRLSVWDLERLEKHVDLPIEGGEVKAMAFADAADRVAIGTDSGSVRVVPIGADQDEQGHVALQAPIGSLAFGPHGDRLAIATMGGGAVHDWTWASGRLETVTTTHFTGEPIVRFSGSGALLVISDEARVWLAPGGHDDAPLGVGEGALWGGGWLGTELVYLLHGDGVEILDRASGDRVARLPMNANLTVETSASRDGDVLAVGGFSDVTTFVASSARHRAELRSQRESETPLAYAESDAHIAAALAEWYLAHGFARTAGQYLERTPSAAAELGPVRSFRAFLANDQVDQAATALTSATRAGDLGGVSAALAAHALRQRREQLAQPGPQASASP